MNKSKKKTAPWLQPHSYVPHTSLPRCWERGFWCSFKSLEAFQQSRQQGDGNKLSQPHPAQGLGGHHAKPHSISGCSHRGRSFALSHGGAQGLSEQQHDPAPSQGHAGSRTAATIQCNVFCPGGQGTVHPQPAPSSHSTHGERDGELLWSSPYPQRGPNFFFKVSPRTNPHPSCSKAPFSCKGFSLAPFVLLLARLGAGSCQARGSTSTGTTKRADTSNELQ